RQANLPTALGLKHAASGASHIATSRRCGAANTAKPLARRVTSGFAFVPNVPVWVSAVGLSNRQRPCPSAQEGTCPVQPRKIDGSAGGFTADQLPTLQKKAVAFDRDQIVGASIRPRYSAKVTGSTGLSRPTFQLFAPIERSRSR